MGFQEQYCKESTWAAMCTWGCHVVAVTEDTSNPLGVLPGTHLRYGAPWITISLQPTLTDYCILKQGKWVRKGLRNSDELPAAREPCQPAVLPWHHLTQAPPTPPLRGPWHLVFSRNTHCYSEITLLTDVHLSYCLSQFINTARRTLNKCNRSKVFPNLSILVQTLSLSKYDDIASYLIKDILC